MSSRIGSRMLRGWGASACRTRRWELARGHTSVSREQRRLYSFNDDADSYPEQGRSHAPNDDANSHPEPYSTTTTSDNYNPSKRKPTIDHSLLATIKKQPSLPYVVGTDICHIPRIKAALERQPGGPGYEGSMTGLWRRVLTPLEIYSFTRLKKGLATNPDRTPKALAGRWAAKEAILKAFYIAYPVLNKKLFMHDVVILKPSFEQTIISQNQAAPPPPRAGESALSAAMREAVEDDGGVTETEARRGPPRAYVRLPMKWKEDSPWIEVSLSISHDAEYATAVALVTVDPTIELDVSTVRIPAYAREKPAYRNIRTGELVGSGND